ncbi:MAG TPA: exosortase/archaeosortase family protein [Chthoniobacterales bacterium]|jgi:exosortase|nr:exosortase/archaeosortase family protein [Chthoniobacterales bacterium]
MNEAAERTWFQQITDAIRREPLIGLLVASIIGTFVYFFGIAALFSDRRLSAFAWAWQAWNPETNYEHAKVIPFVVLGLLWYDRKRIVAAPIKGSNWGWLFLGIGFLMFWIGARTVQARFALAALPFTIFGAVLYLYGKQIARITLFPIAFLLFMVPLNFVSQATARLQFLETAIASAVCNLLGIHVNTVGTMVNSADNSFHFQIDEGCSGIHSLMAIAMLAAVYGHFTQDRLWKKLAIFAGALLFAVIGNAGRLVSIFAFARFFGEDLAGGPYHAVSGYLSFPFAIAAMVLFGMLLNIHRKREQKVLAKP